MKHEPAPAADLFPGFAEHRIDAGEATIFARVGGAGPGLLLLHGYPQSHAAWHRVAPALARMFTVVAADTRGYGRSSTPPTDGDHRPYAKRAMGRDMAAVMRHLGFEQFSAVGHGRGGRVAFRIALDNPGLLDRLVLIDMIPTQDQWEAFERMVPHLRNHWSFLMQPAPLPEGLIGRNPTDWLEARLKRLLRTGSLDVLDPRALSDYRRYFMEADRIHAICEDHRAGGGCDLEDDAADLAAGRRIASPVMVVMASHGFVAALADPVAPWTRWCSNLTGHTIDSGHFVAEENPAALLQLIVPFLQGGQDVATSDPVVTQ